MRHRWPSIVSKEVKSSTHTQKGPSAENTCVSVCVCVAVGDTCCFNRRRADVTARAKKPPLKKKGFEEKKKKSRGGLICSH